MHWTTLKQSQNLIKLGINENTSDMHWVLEETSREGDPYEVHYVTWGKCPWPHLRTVNYPAWSLEKLLSLLNNYSLTTNDDHIYLNNEMSRCYTTKITLKSWEFTATLYGDSIIEAAYNAVCWLLKNGYKKYGNNL